jgi:ubiquinone/menaquinone biosynthesis C-methylase UbiE
MLGAVAGDPVEAPFGACGDSATTTGSRPRRLGARAELVRECGIGAGQQVLGVAAGSGNVALRAAEAGATVVASDIAPENLEAGRREARARGLELDWVEADAEALPFADDRFDAVTSSFGAIFAPDHRAVAGELLRVCRSGGTIGMLNFTPEGLGGAPPRQRVNAGRPPVSSG